MNFLNLPIFPFALDWSATGTKRWLYDARDATIGFGAEFLDLIQDKAYFGYDFSVYLPDAAAVGSWESWWLQRAVLGNSFWLPELRRASEVIEVVSDTQIDVAMPYFATGDTIWLVDPGGNGSARKLTGVSPSGATNYRLTLDGSLAVSVGWEIYRLLLVRLASDKVEMRWLAANRATSKIRVVEVPGLIPATVEEQPLWLYKMKSATTSFYYTSHQSTVRYGGQDYLPVPITHGAIREALSGDKNECSITCAFFDGNPLNSRVPFADAAPLSIQIYRLGRGVPGAEELFNGRIGAVALDGNQLKAKCTTERAIFGSQFPQFYIQSRCNHLLFSPACGLSKTSWDASGTLVSQTRNKLTVSGSAITSKSNDWFAGGYVQIGSETMAVTKSNNAELWLAAPLRHAADGDSLVVYAGCSKSSSACKNKFSNFSNFGGHLHVPRENLTLKAVNYDSSTPVGGK